MGQYTSFPINNRTFTDFSTLVFLSDFGVVGNGVADDTAAINAAFATLTGKKGTVVWNVGFCKVTSTIIVGQLSSSGVTSFINIFCPLGQNQSGILWNGPLGGNAIAFARNKYFRVVGLNVVNNNAWGNGTGIIIGGDGAGFGNACLAGSFNSCRVQGFNVGITDGNFGACSEIMFDSLQIENCTTGFIVNDFNSLDFTFNMVSLASCGVGLDTGAPSGFAVYGGSASQSSVADIQIRQNSSMTSIHNFRSETSVLFIKGLQTGGSVTTEKCLVIDAQAPNFESVAGLFGSIVLKDTAFDGFINFGAIAPTNIEVTNCSLTRWDTTHSLPVVMALSDAGISCPVIFRGNLDNGAFPQRRIPDFIGAIGGMNNGLGGTNPMIESVSTIFPVDKTLTDTIGTPYLALNHVRQLAEGTMKGFATTVTTSPQPGQNLRVSGTFATSNSLAFTFKRNLTVTCAATATITATAGTFLPTDVGKPVKITAGADTGADWFGYVIEYLTPTTVNVYPGIASPGSRYPQGAGKATVVGADEPDAKYMVAGLCGNANETFWVDTLATTGFTLHSSNGASTATVVALIVR